VLNKGGAVLQQEPPSLTKWATGTPTCVAESGFWPLSTKLES